MCVFLWFMKTTFSLVLSCGDFMKGGLIFVYRWKGKWGFYIEWKETNVLLVKELQFSVS